MIGAGREELLSQRATGGTGTVMRMFALHFGPSLTVPLEEGAMTLGTWSKFNDRL